MRTTAKFAVLPALALALAACGDDPAEVETGQSELGVEDPAADFPAVPDDARSSLDWAGTYQQRTADGRLSTLTLSQDDSFTMTDADGMETTGTFNWYADNSRILIKQGEEDMVFAIADGALYRLSGPDAPVDGDFTESQTWREQIELEY